MRQEDKIIIIKKEPWKIRTEHMPEKEQKEKVKYNRKQKHKKSWIDDIEDDINDELENQC